MPSLTPAARCRSPGRAPGRTRSTAGPCATGTGGDAAAEAMRANLTFQNTLRVDAHGVGTPDASQTLSAKRSRRARERAALARASARPRRRRWTRSAAPIGREPVTAQGGDHAPEAGVGAPEARRRGRHRVPSAWLPAGDAAGARSRRREDPAQAHADDSLRHARRGGDRGGDNCRQIRGHDLDRSGRLPIFERLYRRGPAAALVVRLRRSRTSAFRGRPSPRLQTRPLKTRLLNPRSRPASRRICVRRGERSRC